MVEFPVGHVEVLRLIGEVALDAGARKHHDADRQHRQQARQTHSVNGDVRHLLRCSVARDAQAQKLVRRGGFDRVHGEFSSNR
jgi:hypothetical protein